MINRHLRRFALAAIGAVALAPLHSAAHAQRSMVFQHGIMSEGGTWTQLSGILNFQFQITPFVTTTSARLRFIEQAPQLVQQVAGAAPDAVILGHSNGGLIARVANMPNHGNRSWGGLITIGSGHRGAPLADRMRDGSVFNWLTWIANQMLDPINTYSWYWDDGWLWQAIRWVYDFLDLRNDLLVGLGQLAVFSSQPVTSDMGWFSTFFGILSDINFPTNRLRESQAIPQRIGINSTTGNAGLVWKSIKGGGYQGWRNAQLGLAYAFFGVGAYYDLYWDTNDPYYWDKIDNAWRWYNAGYAVYYMDADWCYAIGAEISYHNCGPSDAIVPTNNQVYPGAVTNLAISGPSHVEETKSAQLQNTVSNLLAGTFQIPYRNDPTPAYITGPSSIQAGILGTWTINKSWASCTWYVDYSLYQEGSCWLSTYFWDPYTYHEISVVGNTGGAAALSIWVTEQGDNEEIMPYSRQNTKKTGKR